MYLPYNKVSRRLNLEFDIRLTENSIGPFVIACHRLVDIDLHDSTKGTITLVCQITQSYFKDICISYRTAILLSYNKKKLVLHLVCYKHCFNHSVT